MTKEIILNVLNEHKRKGRYLFKFLQQNYPDIYDEFIERTRFLDLVYEQVGKPVPLQARIYCVEHEITSIPKCHNPDCDNTHFILWDYCTRKFRTYCCNACKSAWFKSDEFKQKSHATCERDYGNKFYFCTDTFKKKSQAKCEQKYGVKFISQDPGFRQQIQEICQERYNANSPFESDEIKAKIAKRNLETLGVENPFLSGEIQQGIRTKITELYGGLGYASKILSDKAHAACKEIHGYEHYTQCPEYHKNKKHRFTTPKYPGVSFDSNWEIDVYDFLSCHDIEFEYQPSLVMEYEYDGRTFTYHPDFLICGDVVEVKGNQFFRINESTGEEEMFCPYRYPDWSDEKHEWMSRKFEAKHQCMLHNGVVIIRDVGDDNLGHIFGKYMK